MPESIHRCNATLCSFFQFVDGAAASLGNLSPTGTGKQMRGIPDIYWPVLHSLEGSDAQGMFVVVRFAFPITRVRYGYGWLKRLTQEWQE